ncbi:MAG: S41 family peptidase [candidate division WOR-3 bacterium]|nr:S41 family peptidase [candidate division WOR-3 bacterium]MCX7947955.1 S41 family peptidase [candidate division WOR-3 bacterium]MDW8150899.1 S41 family peptidase [candidate division WOR-3 bacterium]
MRNLIIILVSIFFGFAIGYALQSTSSKSLRTLQTIYDEVIRIIQNYYVEEENPADLIEESIKGMLQSLDPYSEFLTPQDLEKLKTTTTGTYGGVGMEVRKQGNNVVIVSTFEGTPAYRVGLKSGDIIIKVNDTSVSNMELEDVISMIKGDPGTRVKLTILRPGFSEFLTFDLVREIINVPVVSYFGILNDNVGYIRFAQFSQGSADKLNTVIDSLRRMGAKKFILDLRGNPGGLLYEAVRVSNIFLDKNMLITFTKGRSPDAEEYYRATDKVSLDFNIPVVVLIDYGSASASEIVAGALQDWDRAIIIGDTSYGKGSVQRVIPLGDNYAIKLTTSRYYTPSGRSIDRTTKTLRERKEKIKREDNLLFFTKRLNRKVYGGGGIAPDIPVEVKTEPQIVAKMIGEGLFNEFAMDWKRRNPNVSNFNVNEETYNQFKEFAKKKGYDEKEIEFNKDRIMRNLDISISELISGSKGRYEKLLKYDEVVKKAQEFLSKVKTTDDLFNQLKAYRNE